MKWILVIGIVFAVNSSRAESVVSCSATGTFHRYRKIFFGFSKRIGENRRELCPGALPPLRSPESGIEVETTCSSEGGDTGYGLTVRTQKQINGTAVTLFLYQAKRMEKGERSRESTEVASPVDRVTVTDESPDFQKSYSTDIVTSKSGPDDYEKLDSVRIHCRSESGSRHVASR